MWKFTNKYVPNNTHGKIPNNNHTEKSVNFPVTKEQYTPRLNSAVLAATSLSASSVENEELQAPTMCDVEEPLPPLMGGLESIYKTEVTVFHHTDRLLAGK